MAPAVPMAVPTTAPITTPYIGAAHAPAAPETMRLLPSSRPSELP
eukprot:CAMPEP_0205931386 /NCGR_PEP_ID=MMETSP1325-20131115/27313_1 /ASSEMBLY_ACC=CAM_ASM_000708 /TAXON_ID=236786 /ORGANISM="Florenciella sp., Strain RCC1007" /LENGTH=44 /DNA_ID= /DNA_START= /DNA_END= /DNA_ORIENTATION=